MRIIIMILVAILLFLSWFSQYEDVLPSQTLLQTQEIEEPIVFRGVEKADLPFQEALKIDIGVNRDVLREHNLTLHSIVKNPKHGESYQYRWYEGQKLLGVEASLMQNYSLGEHTVMLLITTPSGREGNASLLVRAWEYKRITSEITDREKIKIEIFDYKNRLLVTKNIYENRRYSTFYNKKGEKQEERYEDIDNPLESYSEYYYYEEGTLKRIERLNASDELIQREVEENKPVVDREERIYDKQGRVIKKITKNLTLYVRMSAKGTFTGYGQEVINYQYNEFGKIAKEENLYKITHTEMESYNSKVREDNNSITRHVIKSSEYDKDGDLVTEKTEKLNNCFRTYNVHKFYTNHYHYDAQKHLVEIETILTLDKNISVVGKEKRSYDYANALSDLL